MSALVGLRHGLSHPTIFINLPASLTMRQWVEQTHRPAKNMRLDTTIRGVSYRLDHGPWTEMQLKHAIENLNIAADAKR